MCTFVVYHPGHKHTCAYTHTNTQFHAVWQGKQIENRKKVHNNELVQEDTDRLMVGRTVVGNKKSNGPATFITKAMRRIDSNSSNCDSNNDNNTTQEQQ